MIVFTLFFGRLAQMPSDGLPYPIFVYAGLLPWTYFANAVSASGNSLVGSANLITKDIFHASWSPHHPGRLLDFFLALFVLAAS
jgi:lipopolysaccharide transport system permease protein